MPTTRKKAIKTVYKDEESEGETGDFSDSGSEAKISEASSSEDDLDDAEDDKSSGDDFRNQTKKKTKNPQPLRRKPKPFAKELIKKINKQDTAIGSDENVQLPVFSMKDLTDADKLLPSVLNLSESDSSDDESQSQFTRKKAVPTLVSIQEHQTDSDDGVKVEYKDVWSTNIQDNSEDIAKKTFMELEKHNNEIEKTKASVESYVAKNSIGGTFDVKDLLARGEVAVEQVISVKKKGKAKKRRDDSDSEVEDWEEVKESKIPQQGLQLVVELPNTVCRKSKTVDVEMMMKRKINRVKKEYQVYMHKVHVLCWLGHGNYVSRVLNDQEVMAAALAMVPKGCYPEERLTMKYVEQITTWYKDKLTLKQDKHEHKFRPKAPPLKDTILNQIKTRITTTKKYNILIFVAMLRALGLQCRIMFNFVAVPIRPPSSELCSLSTKPKEDKNKTDDKSAEKATEKSAGKIQSKAKSKSKPKCDKKMAQVDGIDDSLSETDDMENSMMQIDDCEFCSENESNYGNIMQIDGNDDARSGRSTRAGRAKKAEADNVRDRKEEREEVSPPKRSKTCVASDKHTETNDTDEYKEPSKSRTKRSAKNKDNALENIDDANISKEKQLPASKSQTKRLTKSKNVKSNNDDVSGDNGDPRQPLKSATTRKSANNKETPISNTPNTTEKKVMNADNKSLKGKIQTRRSAKSNLTSKVAHGPKADELLDHPNPPLRRKRNTSKDENSSEKNKEIAKSPQTKNKISNLNTDNQNGVLKVHLSPKTSLKAYNDDKDDSTKVNAPSPRKTRSNRRNTEKAATNGGDSSSNTVLPTILVTDDNSKQVKSDFFSDAKDPTKLNVTVSRKRSHTDIVNQAHKAEGSRDMKPKNRAKSAPGDSVEKSKYFDNSVSATKKPRLNLMQIKKEEMSEDKLRVSHKDLSKPNPKNDVTGDLVDIIKCRIRIEKAEAKKGIVKGKVKEDSDDDSDFLPVEDPKSNNDSEDDFTPTKISPRPVSKINPKPGTSKKLDRRVLSSDDDLVKMSKVEVWCEVFVEELEQWISVDANKGKVHCSNELYSQATHPVCYIVGWDNNNYLKDLTRRYVPHWNTVTRKQRAEPDWWKSALQPWLGPKTARDKEEDEYLDRMQLEAPLPKSIAEYKNHPLYALKRHLLKFEAMYPPDAATLGFVRGEAVYARECVYTCRSRDTWLKEAKIVKLGEQPYKVVKARPKWDKLSNKLITDKPLEVFGPWQVQDYEPPTAENGIVPRNAYGNVELFKDCMLPKKTVHIKLPGLNRVAKKLNIDCAPAMTGFDFNGGWSHPVYDGFVVCEEFEEIITEAWVKDQEDQERREREKMESRVFGNWRRLIRGLMIRERLKLKYGFEEPTPSETKKPKGPRFVAKKR